VACMKRNTQELGRPRKFLMRRDAESRPFLKGHQVSVSDAENGGALTASGESYPPIVL